MQILGYALNWALHGALTIQICMQLNDIPSRILRVLQKADLYHISFPRDRWLSRGLFYTLWIIETAQTALLTHDAFNSFVRSFGFAPEMDEVQYAWLAGPVSDATGTFSHPIFPMAHKY